MGIEEKGRAIEFGNKKITVYRQCELLGLSRSALFYNPRGVSEENLELMRLLDEDFRMRFNGIVVPDSIIYCYPTRMSNMYEPFVERVLQPSFTIPGETFSVTIEEKTMLPPYVRLRSRLLPRFVKRRALSPVDLGKRIVYDARFVYNENMAHLVQHHLTTLGFFVAVKGLTNREITVVIETKDTRMAAEVFGMVGYEVVKTDRPVYAAHIEIANQAFFHLLPFVRNLDFRAAKTSFPGKLFIHRKNNRRVRNLVDVEKVLRDYDYESVYFEELSIEDQWSCMANANQVVAVHGAALGCLAFNFFRANAYPVDLVELFGPGFVVNPFRKYMAVLGGRWSGCRGKITPRVMRNIDKPSYFKRYAYEDFDLSAETIVVALDALQ